ncbi:short-chain dehydrogenase [Actinoplanes philippinensis]|uniref:NAD(P)-dependent dehydrogenase, short-chain alcohol dehydrogenase family n=1 Tax=Actinoplanes philippinensis TaxID=35752 RepID=A0A1I2HGG0_9ACTN|nr:SDR family oxidoreductase [Actinoplanes philippinensis]GIE81750.1 short-chain dehydrogenase [Actinoplanes philippinensis]SFF28483.1 NAD(P)-dependent dehydrogenase, short-chain alcohol dehydrogenase family [Actinoplanes philippinensis]
MATALSGKTALVTGGNSGIGRATATALAALGATVVITGRDTLRGEQTVHEIAKAGGTAHFVAADLDGERSARKLAATAQRLAGPIDILVNSAGVFPFGPTASTTTEQFDQVYALNVKAPYFLVAELAPKMAARGGGTIVNVTTMVAEFGMAGMGLYGSSKAAIASLTRSWAAEFGPAGVRVNAVSPGPTRTEGTAAMGENLGNLASAAPAGRAAGPEEIAAAIVFLAGDDASFMHGAVVPVDGGRTAV